MVTLQGPEHDCLQVCTCNCWVLTSQLRRRDKIMPARERFCAVIMAATSREEVSHALDQLGQEGSDLEPCCPVDWEEQPPSLMEIQCRGGREFALTVNGLWPQLFRQVRYAALCRHQHTGG